MSQLNIAPKTVKQAKKKHERIVRVRFSGHGHYKVTINYYKRELTALITDMTLIDDYKDEDSSKARMNELYDRVKRLSLMVS